MIVELGHFALALALAVASLQMLFGLWGARVHNLAMMQASRTAAQAQAGLLLTSFLALMWAYITSDFSVLNVATNSHSLKPMLYKISGVWGNHEGSMLMWVLMLAVFGAAVAVFGRNLPDRLRSNVLGVQASIAVAFTLFLLLTSNPFERIDPAPFDGNGLNPILQDPALAFHPPFLYAGYVGFSIAFSFAIAALIEGRTDAAWARWVRPWTLAAWMCLTMGIAMGSWWAYYELGWGGWWFWDPVENASFMPWLAGTALLHSAVVMEKREALKVWTMLLAIIAFSLSLLGTFLVRSGVLSSVHAFAVDPARGVFILGLMVLFVGGAFALFAWRMRDLRQGGMFSGVSREGGLVLNNVALTTACATVLVGTLYPLALEAITGDKISVGPPYFNITFSALMLPLLIALPFGPLLAWKRGDLAAAALRLKVAAVIAGIVMFAVLAFNRTTSLAPLGLGLGVWVVIGSLTELVAKTRLGEISFADSWDRLKGLPRSSLGTTFAHLGVGMMVLGVVATSAYQQEKVLTMQPGERTSIAGYTLAFTGTQPVRGPNFVEEVGTLEVLRGTKPVATLYPGKRLYDQPKQPTTEAGIHNALGGDLYVVLGDRQSDGGYTMRLYFNPLVRLIWLGAVVMFIGGGLSLSDRRLRVGAPKRAKVRGVVQAAE
jgi:cytochrome c-type biogenesis protein CcmF